jgi:dTDP-4-dehydrorhamnose 3,5-epimerase
MVTCISGSILDVVIDCRESSPNYGRVCKILLAAHDGKSVVVPKGFAHGFQTLSDDATVLYCVDERYEPSAQLGINPLSAPLNAIWPIKSITISPQDNCLPLWEDFMQTEAIID